MNRSDVQEITEALVMNRTVRGKEDDIARVIALDSVLGPHDQDSYYDFIVKNKLDPVKLKKDYLAGKFTAKDFDQAVFGGKKNKHLLRFKKEYKRKI